MRGETRQGIAKEGHFWGEAPNGKRQRHYLGGPRAHQEHTKSTPEEKARDMLYVSIKKQQQTNCAPHSRTRRLRLYVDNAQWNQKWWFTWRARSRVSWFEQLAGRMFLAGGLQAPVLLGGEG
jgi:hypothetical protein